MKKFVAMVFVLLFIANGTANAIEKNYGDIAYGHLLKFSLLGNRALVTQSEKNSRDYIIDTLQKMGYKSKNLKFKVENYDTYNIEVNKKGKDTSKTIILGAHYDGRIEGNAFDDNGSGISILLELCEIFKDIDSPCNLKFIFFGAEEINILGKGLHGSYNYVESLSSREKYKIKYMINLDTLASGDKMYVYNSYKDKEVDEFSKKILKKIKEVSENIDININFNYNEEGNISFTNTKSDYYPFFENNIPFLYFESTNWEAGENDGRSQTELLGRIIHSRMDNMIFLENIFNDRIKDRLRSYVELVKELILSEV